MLEVRVLLISYRLEACADVFPLIVGRGDNGKIGCHLGLLALTGRSFSRTVPGLLRQHFEPEAGNQPEMPLVTRYKGLVPLESDSRYPEIVLTDVHVGAIA